MAKHDFEGTGMREICGFFANTWKILAEDEDHCIGGYWLAGAYYDCISAHISLAEP